MLVPHIDFADGPQPMEGTTPAAYSFFFCFLVCFLGNESK